MTWGWYGLVLPLETSNKNKSLILSLAESVN